LVMLQPWPMKILVDNVLSSSPLPPFLARGMRFLGVTTDRHFLLGAVAIAGLLFFAANRAVQALLSYVSIKGSWNTVHHLAESMFDRLQRHSLSYHKNSAVGELMNRVLGDSRCGQEVLERLLFRPAVSVITITGTFLLMTRISIGLTLLAFTVAPVSWIVSVFASRRLRY